MLDFQFDILMMYYETFFLSEDIIHYTIDDYSRIFDTMI